MGIEALEFFRLVRTRSKFPVTFDPGLKPTVESADSAFFCFSFDLQGIQGRKKRLLRFPTTCEYPEAKAINGYTIVEQS